MASGGSSYVQNAKTIVGNPDAIIINDSNLQTGILHKNRLILRNVKCWHKFIVSNTEGLSRNEVLTAILKHVYPMDLIPVFYVNEIENSHSYFLARNCEAAIEKLCAHKLVVNHPHNKKADSHNFSPLKLTIVLNFASTNDVKVDVQKNVSMVLAKRFRANTKTMNLDQFHEDPDLTDFCPLFQPKIMYFILHIVKSFAPDELVLSNNSIKLLNPLEVLIGVKLNRLDLSNNELSTLNDLDSLKFINVKNLKLTGNPLCNCKEEEYISKIRQTCPKVDILDGVLISLDKLPTTQKYSFCDYQSTDLVNQFLEYFFTFYDEDRKALAGLYHSNAMFSLTCVYLPNQQSSNNAFLKSYMVLARNLKKAADMSKASECLFRGRENIVNILTNRVPLTEHDPYSFTIDLMYKTDKCAIIVVHGVFHEKPTSLLDKEQFLGFSRSFALEISGSKCVITNDQLHVYNGLTYQEKISFIQPIEPRKLSQKELIPRPQTKADCSVLITTLSHITNLNENWSEKCLEECFYDLKASLELFVHLYKGDKIPNHAFKQQ